MPWGPQPLVPPLRGDAKEHPDIIGATHGFGHGPSETYPAIPLFRGSNYSRAANSLQIAGFRPAEGSCGPLRPVATSPTPPGNGAKHPCGTTGDREEGENRTSQQAYSGRPARTLIGLVPEASNGPASPQSGEVGSQRPNQPSVCQSREQRDTSPRTPLHASEGRPRARYDKKESSKCSQIEYDSC